jgi:hypothetical protein
MVREALMLGIQIKAFAMLTVVLFVVDAAAFHGEYRRLTGEKLGHLIVAVTPGSWSGMGQGRDWSAPKPPRHD